LGENHKTMGKDIKKLKVDILTPIRFGGPQKWGDDLVRALKKEGVEARNIHNFWGIVKRFFWTDADVIHAASVPLFFNLLGKPIVLTIHGDYRRESHPWDFTWPLAIKRANEITTSSEFMKKELNLNRAKVINTGIFLEEYNIKNSNNSKKICLVTVTGFSFPEKSRGVLELLKILEEVKKKTKQKFKFVVVGGGPYLDKIKEESKKYDVPVEFIGFHPNPKEILQKSDIFVYYSLHDNYPGTILEAMACGLPVVSNDVGAVKEIISEDNFGVCTNENKKYIESLIDLLKNPKKRRKMGKSGKKLIEKKLSWKSLAKEFITLYKNDKTK